MYTVGLHVYLRCFAYKFGAFSTYNINTCACDGELCCPTQSLATVGLIFSEERKSINLFPLASLVPTGTALPSARQGLA